MHGKAYYILIILVIVAVGGVMVAKNRVSQSNQPEQGVEAGFHDISAAQANQLIQANPANPDFVILDVRTPEEYQDGHIEESLLLDYYDDDFRTLLRQLDRNKTYLVYCRSGNRSAQALRVMREEGFGEVYNMLGGFTAWKQQGLPVSR